MAEREETNNRLMLSEQKKSLEEVSTIPKAMCVCVCMCVLVLDNIDQTKLHLYYQLTLYIFIRHSQQLLTDAQQSRKHGNRYETANVLLPTQEH